MKQDNYYGLVWWRCIGTIDFVRVSSDEKGGTDWVNHFHPLVYFDEVNYTHFPQNETFFNKVKSLRSVVYTGAMSSDNINWYRVNQHKETDYKKCGGNSKTLPIAISDKKYLKWFEASRKYFTTQWVADNKEFMVYWEDRLQTNLGKV